VAVSRTKLKPPAPVTQAAAGVRREVVDTDVRPTVGDEDPSYDKDLVTKTRVDFRKSEFVSAIRSKGYWVRWRKALLCTCVSPETEQSRLPGVCNVCDGSGYFFVDPQEIQAIMSGFSKQTDIYRRPGEWVSGQSQITVEPQYRIGYRDSIEMMHSVAVFNEWLVKGNRNGVRSKLPAKTDSARYRIVRATVVMYADSSGAPVALEEKIDFNITKDGWIAWTPTGDEKVADGTVLSIHYEFHPVYVVVSHPHVLRDTLSRTKLPRDTIQNLPLQAAVSLDYLLDVNKALPTTTTYNP